MQPCPTHDASTHDLLSLILRMEDPDTIVTLACDIAERVADRAASPQATRRMLDAARAWRDEPQAVRKAHTREDLKWKAKSSKLLAAGEYQPVWATKATIEALGTAQGAIAQVIDSRPDTLYLIQDGVVQAATAVLDAVEIGTNDAEAAWQIKHAEALACTCPVLSEADPTEARTRNSTLSD